DGNATTEADGTKTAKCDNCDETDTVIDEGSKIHVHSHDSVVTNPTCTEGGYTTHTCECGDSYTDSEVPATGHSFTNYVSDGNATTEADGTKTAKCDNCEETDTVIDGGSKIDPSKVVYGDLSGDNRINMDDVIMLLRHVSKAHILTDSKALEACNIVEDGIINMDDVIRLLRYVSKAIPNLK
ncbi:MAG: dockerin type I repeat-containing protein, partial [Clostridia bacterium]|nr:dockerin type I repeat-containing protein [Clostridia bacterium]